MQHLILVLNCAEAVSHFAGRGLNMSFTLQAALGPHQAGRCVEGGVRLSFTPGPTAAAGAGGSAGPLVVAPPQPPGGAPRLVGSYVYGEAGGFFLGAGIQVGLVVPRDWENASYYGTASAPAAAILSGQLGLTEPWPEVQELHAALAMAEEAHASWGRLAGGGARQGSPALGSDAEAGEFELFVPGRLCLLGEHSDWAGAHCGAPGASADVTPGASLVVGLQGEGIYARARRRRGVLVLRALLSEADAAAAAAAGDDFGPAEMPMEAAALAALAAAGGFWSHAAGVACRVLQVGYEVGGLECDMYRSSLPIRAGLSSSSALCVLIARAFSRAYGLGLSVRGEMELAFQGERLARSRCGRGDQACAYGPRPVLLRHDGEKLDVEEVAVGAPLYWLVAYRPGGGAAANDVMAALQAAYPRPAGEAQQAVVRMLGERNLAFVRRACEYVAAGDAPALGALLAESQAEMDAAVCGVCPAAAAACEALQRVLSHPGLAAAAHGGKAVGGGGGGSLQLLCRGEAGQAAAEAVLRDELGWRTIRLTLVPSLAPPLAGVTAEDSLAAAATLGAHGRPAGAGGWLARTRSQLGAL